MGRVSGASLHWEFMGTMLRSVTSDRLKFSRVPSQRDVEPDHAVACFDEVKVLLRDASLTRSFGVKELDLLKEARFTVLIFMNSMSS